MLILAKLIILISFQTTVTVHGNYKATSSAQLAWDAVSGATSYSVYRAEQTNGPYSLIASSLANPTYTDSVVQSGHHYYWVSTATNGSGESGNSNEVNAVIP